MDTGAYSSNWSVFYTGATQIAEIRKNAFGALGGFLGKIVVKTRGLLQPCTGRYTQFWHILAKQRTKNRRFPQHNSLYNCFRTLPTKNRPIGRLVFMALNGSVHGTGMLPRANWADPAIVL